MGNSKIDDMELLLKHIHFLNIKKVFKAYIHTFIHHLKKCRPGSLIMMGNLCYLSCINRIHNGLLTSKGLFCLFCFEVEQELRQL